MTSRMWRRAGIVASASSALLGASLMMGAGSALADPQPLPPSQTTLTNSLNDPQFQLCSAEHDVLLQLSYIESYPSQTPVPGFCVRQQSDEVAIANYVLPVGL